MKYILFVVISVLAACADQTKFGPPAQNGGGDERVELVPAASCERSSACSSDQHCVDGMCVEANAVNRCDDAHVCSGGDACGGDGICR